MSRYLTLWWLDLVDLEGGGVHRVATMITPRIITPITHQSPGIVWDHLPKPGTNYGGWSVGGGDTDPSLPHSLHTPALPWWREQQGKHRQKELGGSYRERLWRRRDGGREDK